MDGELFILYSVILAIIGLATLVRKAIEKASTGKKGKRIHLAAAVQKQLKKYMDPMERRAVRPPPEPVERADERESEAPRLRAPPTEPPPAALPSRPKMRGARGGEGLGPGLREAMELECAQPPLARPVLKGRIVDRATLREAILLAELLGPPVSERKDYRLF